LISFTDGTTVPRPPRARVIYVPRGFETVALRLFDPRDLEPVMSLVTTTFQQVFSEEMYLAVQQAWPEGQIIDVEEGRLAGVLLSMRRSAISARVLVMAVREGYRDMGIGSLMLRAFVQQCVREGIVSIVLEVRISNLMAREFYRRFGFRSVEPLVDYYPDGEDGVLMTMDLA
jgi:ribosomal-protein-alanine N-acetyltransferase